MTHVAKVEEQANAADSKQQLFVLRAWLRAFGDIARLVNRDGTLVEVVDAIAKTVRELTGYESCALFIAESDPPRLVVQGSSGLSADYVAALNKSLLLIDSEEETVAPSLRAFSLRRAVVVDEIATSPLIKHWSEEAIREGLRSLLAVPVVASNRALGVLTCYSAQKGNFSPDSTAMVEILADQAAIAIDASRLRTSERDTIADLEDANTALEEHLRVSERIEQAHRDLIGTAVEGADLAELIDATSRLVGSKVRLHAHDTPGVPPPEDPPAVPDAVRFPVVQDQRVAGYLEAEVGETSSPQGQFKRRALESGAWVVALELQRQATAQEVWLRLSGDLLGDILKDSPSRDPVTIHRRAARLGHDLSQPHAILVVGPDQRADDRPLVDTRRLVDAVRSAVDGCPGRAAVGMVGDNVVALVPSESDDISVYLSNAAETIQRRVRTASDGATVSVAIGSISRELDEYMTAYELAASALAIKPGPETISLPSDLGIYRFLLQVRRPKELREFAEGMLAPLKNAQRSDLLGTLNAFLVNDLSTVKTAEALFVHVNTVGYRLRRVEDLLDIDLHDTEALLNLRFALMVDEMLNDA